ncbi:uncharacterized protein LACBIDRAFT_323098 [Laccaria bicolor S238N-H82]|uniref:Predicted protein n=1 Tax=Laccaria bicolor (strain S238N-H82 / ATCC MYA-4686) TaxID=486041 RepID=B0CZ48_LACBS|nr:uncharacterized protein LACBIDRAFT_323098 [Laccaria bicolor S238N-H82]EDR12559.1 predicted protein [Laccaria bicolor S238N-H82]|eukprot:XP_001876823.1 predicted protein [Laccaria bicolor S238N-H82]
MSEIHILQGAQNSVITGGTFMAAETALSRVTPGYFRPYPYPYPWKPVPSTTGRGFCGNVTYKTLPLSNVVPLQCTGRRGKRRRHAQICPELVVFTFEERKLLVMLALIICNRRLPS